jgi:hypothetical protein
MTKEEQKNQFYSTGRTRILVGGVLSLPVNAEMIDNPLLR